MKTFKNKKLSCANLLFDAYSFTMAGTSWTDVFECFPEDAREDLDIRIDDNVNFYGYTRAVYVTKSGRHQVAKFLYGATGELFVEVKGDLTDPFVRNLRARYKHQVTRMDICLDTRRPGAFMALLEYCLHVKKMNPRTRSERRGDWDDHPEDGRTFYLGSRSSLCQVCLYEKGKTRPYRGAGLEDWVRLEWRFRPETKAQKVLASMMEPHEMLMLSTMSRRLAELVLADFDASQKVDVPRLKSSPEKAFDYMMGQYSKTMWKMADRMGGVGKLLAEIGIRLTGQPWSVQLLDDHVDDQPPFSNKGGQDLFDLDAALHHIYGQNHSWNDEEESVK